MRNTKTVTLLTLVVIIWGTIGYKIYEKMMNEDRVSGILRESEAGDTVDQFDYRLSLKYRDPFFKPDVGRDKLIVRRKVTPKPSTDIAARPTVTVDWGRVSFQGILLNVSSGIQTAIVVVDGSEYFVNEGDAIKEFLVIHIAKDSVLVTAETQSNYIMRTVRKNN